MLNNLKLLTLFFILFSANNLNSLCLTNLINCCYRKPNVEERDEYLTTDINKLILNLRKKYPDDIQTQQEKIISFLENRMLPYVKNNLSTWRYYNYQDLEDLLTDLLAFMIIGRFPEVIDFLLKQGAYVDVHVLRIAIQQKSHFTIIKCLLKACKEPDLLQSIFDDKEIREAAFTACKECEKKSRLANTFKIDEEGHTWFKLNDTNESAFCANCQNIQAIIKKYDQDRLEMIREICFPNCDTDIAKIISEY